MSGEIKKTDLDVGLQEKIIAIDTLGTGLESYKTEVITALNTKANVFNIPGYVEVDYTKYVVALCSVDNTNPSASSYSIGTLTTRRGNGTWAALTYMFNAEKHYNNSIMLFSSAMLGGPTGALIKPCTFTYDGKLYGGLEIYITAACPVFIKFMGDTNFDIFAVRYYDMRTNTVINAEIANSIRYDTVAYPQGLKSNGDNVITDKEIPWIDATLLNGWTGTLQYRKNALGQLEVNLLVSPGTLTPGVVIANIPTSHRVYWDSVFPLYHHPVADASRTEILIGRNSGNIFVRATTATIVNTYYYGSIVLPVVTKP